MAELGVWTIPGYVVHERLDAGLCATSYLASRTSDGYPVLLQVFTEELSDPDSAAHLRATIERASTVEHPVVPSIRDSGDVGGLLYIITSAIEGQPLGLALARSGALPLDEALTACAQLADALDALAVQGIVHGAISPTTVWYNDRDRAPSAPHVSLRGFGNLPLATAAVRSQPEAPPPADICYTAPEQVHGAPIGVRTDQYALACMALHCLTGTPPFVRPTIAALLDAHIRDDQAAALARAEWLPRRVVEGLRRGLSKDPNDRFDTCTALIAALGGTSRRSWSWTRERGRDDPAPREIDVRDPVVVTGPHDRSPPDEPGTARGDGSRTARSLAEVDWLPGSATPTGQQRPVRVSAASHRRRASRRRRIPPDVWRRAGLVVVASVVAVMALAVARALVAGGRTTPPATAADPPTGDTTAEIAASWRERVGQEPVTALATVDGVIVGASTDTVLSVDQRTGDQRWSTRLDAPVRGLSVVGRTAIARTDRHLYGVDVGDGTRRWRASRSSVPGLDAVATGRGRMFGVGRGPDGRLTVQAIDPRSGELGWSVAPFNATGDARPGARTGPSALVAFDGSDQGKRSLYIADGGRLHALDVTTRRPRWTIGLDGRRPTSLIALAGSILVVGSDGEVCRYHADDGRATWTTCPRMQRTDVPAAVAEVRDSRVIVTSMYEVLSIDYTTGTPSWRIVSLQPLQEAIAANRAATYIAGPDGVVEAVGQRSGATLWESPPFGPIGAMTATDDAVFVSTTDGRLARLEAERAGR